MTPTEQEERIACPVCGAQDGPGFPCAHHAYYLKAVQDRLTATEEKLAEAEADAHNARLEAENHLAARDYAEEKLAEAEQQLEDVENRVELAACDLAGTELALARSRKLIARMVAEPGCPEEFRLDARGLGITASLSCSSSTID